MMGEKNVGRTTIGGIEKRNRPSLGNAWGELSVCVRVRSYPQTSRSALRTVCLLCIVWLFFIVYVFVLFFLATLFCVCFLYCSFLLVGGGVLGIVVVLVLGFGAVIIIFVLSYDVAVVCRPIRQSPPTDDKRSVPTLVTDTDGECQSKKGSEKVKGKWNEI